ncbi:hypothetical protein A9G28_00860 [Gilliamella sp. Fer1-1]|uniref:hypothetical protein n=1 Tax=Gilliamella sp. Fer1-1 TaxID=3120240 RepID=UPI00080DDA83|nr:hypothetical protein [Gilliamella apicola]OCG41529.1 hypothetical protein A9G28_00860 [Gilliamella apicola]
MGWNIPKLLEPKQQPIKYTSYLLFINIIPLIFMGFALTVLFYNGTNQAIFWFFSVILPLIIWLLMLAIKINSSYFNDIYNEELAKVNEESTQHWQAWSKVQIPIFASHVICAEPNGVQTLIGDPKQMPLYPAKARPLFNSTASNKPFWFLNEVMQNLEQQCPNYRKYLSHIYLPQSLMDDEDLTEAIFTHWRLRVEPIMDYNVWIAELYQHTDDIELSLILTCQYNDTSYHHHSKFISALLIGGTTLIDNQKLQAKAWLGRLMVAEQDLSADLTQLVTYTQLPVTDIKDIWVSGLDRKNRTALAITINTWGIDNNDNDDDQYNQQLIHNIDLTFAKPTELTKYFALALASNCIDSHFYEQLCVVQFDHKTILQLITHQKLV